MFSISSYQSCKYCGFSLDNVRNDDFEGFAQDGNVKQRSDMLVNDDVFVNYQEKARLMLSDEDKLGIRSFNILIEKYIKLFEKMSS